MSSVVAHRVPAEVWRQLQTARDDASLAGRLAGGEGEDLSPALGLLASAGDAMAEVAAHPGVPESSARSLLRTRDALDAHVLAARSLHDLALADDARRLIRRGAATVMAAFEPDSTT